MGNQLKEALLNAGVISKKDVEREKVKKRHVSKNQNINKNQIRIVCDACEKSAPDVECYKHSNKRIRDKEWLCVLCADEYCIDDQCRESNQSTHAKTGLFRRGYGRTKRFSK